MQHFHQITLGVHDFVDVLVGHRDLIDDRRILAAFHMGGRADLVGDGEGVLGFGAAHGATGAVAAGTERLLVAEAANDEAVPAYVLSAALFERFASRNLDLFQNKVLSAMRFGFGGHVEKK